MADFAIRIKCQTHSTPRIIQENTPLTLPHTLLHPPPIPLRIRLQQLQRLLIRIPIHILLTIILFLQIKNALDIRHNRHEVVLATIPFRICYTKIYLPRLRMDVWIVHIGIEGDFRVQIHIVVLGIAD